MRSILLLGVYLGYLVLGASAPFICGLGYIWTDLFTPQNVAYIVLNQIPVSLIMALATIGFYALKDRRDPPKVTLTLVLLMGWIVWVTLTTTWSIFPDNAWFKWNWAIKSIIFAMIMPLLFRSRVQIEAAVLTILFAVSGNLITFGIKTIISGGAYGRQWTLGAGTASNTGLNESSTIAIVSVALIPLILFIKRRSLIIPALPLSGAVYAASVVFAVMTCLGSFARAGLVSLCVLGAITWVRSRHKLVTLAGLALAGVVLFNIMPDSWAERMATIANPTSEESAAGRLEVWKWTLGFVADHPFGGGFDAYRANSFVLQLPDGTEHAEQGRAFHSMYFEILGEHGYPGMMIFASLIASFFASNLRVIVRTKAIPELEWLRDLAWALMVFTIVYLCGGTFVGISFQPLLYYMLALGISVSEHYRRCVLEARPVPRRALPPGRAPEPVRAATRPPTAAR